MTAGRNVWSQSQDWGTPPKYVSAVRRVFGTRIALDPCSNEHSIVDAEVEYALPECDGLNADWNFPSIYVNPPYGTDKTRRTRIADWLKRCADAHETHNSQVLALIPVATNTGHWKKYVWTKAAAVCFLYDTRLRFLVDGEDSGKGAPMSCAMVYWGDNYDLFLEVFIEFGAVVDLRCLRRLSIGKRNEETRTLFSTTMARR